MASPSPSLLEKQDHLTNSGANSALSDPDSLQVSYTEAEEKALVRKLDWALIPGLTFLYLLSFLDRSNGQSLFFSWRGWISSLTFEHAVGNARAAGMLKDIGLGSKPEAYNTSLALYFLGYVLFEIPANIVYVLISFIDSFSGKRSTSSQNWLSWLSDVPYTDSRSSTQRCGYRPFVSLGESLRRCRASYTTRQDSILLDFSWESVVSRKPTRSLLPLADILSTYSTEAGLFPGIV